MVSLVAGVFLNMLAAEHATAQGCVLWYPGLAPHLWLRKNMPTKPHLFPLPQLVDE
jgi:hypothetical protein